MLDQTPVVLHKINKKEQDCQQSNIYMNHVQERLNVKTNYEKCHLLF